MSERRPTVSVPEWRRAMDREIRRAIAEGRHAATRQHVCSGCGEWVESLFHRNVDGKYVGLCCAPKSEIERAEKFAKTEQQWLDAGYVTST